MGRLETSLTFFFLLLLRICSSQNLVLNPSFESYDSCPNYAGGINSISQWNEINYYYSPDCYNSCADSGEYDSPYNFFGYQKASHGTSYAGIVTWVNSLASLRETVCGRLVDSLPPNHIYCIAFYVNLSDSSDYAINRIGALLSDSAFDIATDPPNWMYDIDPSIESDTNLILNDTLNWIKIENKYTSQGGEINIIIGNFRTNSETEVEYINYSNILNNEAYYFIDQVSVEEIKPAHAGSNQTITSGQQVQLGNNVTEDASYQWLPATGLSDPTAPNPIAQPFSTTTYTVTKTQCSAVTTDEVTVTVNTNPAIVVQGTFTLPQLCAENSTAEIFDARGRKVSAFATSQEEALVALAPGMYFLRFQCVNGDVIVRRLVVQE
ncbi:MAG: T9SS type A sorting domain-containing protein [Bacteroidetes bacterium]|nr:T9SS type A sorting domain-containing protein [Bacteroidota bacterium]